MDSDWTSPSVNATGLTLGRFVMFKKLLNPHISFARARPTSYPGSVRPSSYPGQPRTQAQLSQAKPWAKLVLRLSQANLVPRLSQASLLWTQPESLIPVQSQIKFSPESKVRMCWNCLNTDKIFGKILITCANFTWRAFVSHSGSSSSVFFNSYTAINKIKNIHYGKLIDTTFVRSTAKDCFRLFFTC